MDLYGDDEAQAAVGQVLGAAGDGLLRGALQIPGSAPLLIAEVAPARYRHVELPAVVVDGARQATDLGGDLPVSRLVAFVQQEVIDPIT